MSAFLHILDQPFKLIMPSHWSEGIFFLLSLLLIFFLLSKSRNAFISWGKVQWRIFIFLGFITPFLTLFFGLIIHQIIPPGRPWIPLETPPMEVMIFSAIPWILAAYFLGSIPSFILGVIGGIILAFYKTHSLITIVECGLLTIFFQLCITQRLKTIVFSFLRHPIGAGIASLIFIFPVTFIYNTLVADSTITAKIFYAFDQTGSVILEYAISILIAVFVIMVIGRLKAISNWFQPFPKSDELFELSIRSRMRISFVILGIFTLILFTITLWSVVNDLELKSFENDIETDIMSASDSLPNFFSEGESLIKSIASDESLSDDSTDSTQVLSDLMYTSSFFNQLLRVEINGNIISVYPSVPLNQIQLTQEETSAIRLSLLGVSNQQYLVPPYPGEKDTQISFISPVITKDRQIDSVIIGRTDILSNPYLITMFRILNGMNLYGTQTVIIDEYGHIIYHLQKSYIMSSFSGLVSEEGKFVRGKSTDGEDSIIYSRRVVGIPWKYITITPLSRVYEKTFFYILPACAVYSIFLFILFIVIDQHYSRIHYRLRKLMQRMDTSFDICGIQRSPSQNGDEITSLNEVIDRYQKYQEIRFQKINLLFNLSKAIIDNASIEEALKPFAERLISQGASVVRFIFSPDQESVSEITAISFTKTEQDEKWSGIDKYLLDQSSEQERIVIRNTNKIKQICNSTEDFPSSVFAFRVPTGENCRGIFWIGYENSSSLEEEDCLLSSSISNILSQVICNQLNISKSEIENKRLKAVLASSPDPVLILDEENKIIYSNAAARQIPGFIKNNNYLVPVNDAISSRALIEAITHYHDDSLISQEIELSDQRIFNLHLNWVIAGGLRIGKTCLLREITHFRQREVLKTNFLTTVSHDLRSPLSLLRGYFNMLEMVGGLNIEQRSYMVRIGDTVDRMSKMVDNLLDLDRFDGGDELRLERISVIELCNAVLAPFKPQFAQKKISLLFDEASAVPLFFVGDFALMKQSLANLIDNAIKFTHVGGSVTLSVYEDVDWIVFEVMDTGIGIAPIDLVSLRNKTFRTQNGGILNSRVSGLGIMIVKTIVEWHKGELCIDSQLSKGSTFSMRIPLNLD